jgi:hypothetical protein
MTTWIASEKGRLSSVSMPCHVSEAVISSYGAANKTRFLRLIDKHGT